MKKRVMHILSSTQYSGAENVVISIINSLQEDYRFVYVSPKGPIGNVLEDKNIPYLPLESDSVRCLDRVVKTWKPDIVHAHDFRASVKAAFCSYRCVRISHLHHNPSWIKHINPKSILYLTSCLRVNKIVSVSRAILEEAWFTGIIKKKSVVLSNHVDSEAILDAASKASFDTDYDLAFVGRLTEAKNPLKFIRIVEEMTKQDKAITAVMVGDGELQGECRQWIERLELSKNIRMTGFLSNPFSVMNRCKILVMPSIWEGFGLVAVEAMVLGKPVFATPVGGLRDIVNTKCGGFCTSVEEFSKALMKALNDRDYYTELSEEARKKAMRFTDRLRWITDWRNLYGDV